MMAKRTIIGATILIIFLASIPAYLMQMNAQVPSQNNRQIEDKNQRANSPNQPQQVTHPLNVLPAQVEQPKEKKVAKEAAQNEPARQFSQIAPPPNWIEGGIQIGRTFMLVNATNLKHSETTITLTDSQLGQLSNLRRALGIHTKQWEQFATECRLRLGECSDRVPESVYVGVNYTEFSIINATFRPSFTDEKTFPGGAIEVRKIVQELPGGQTKVIEEKVVVNRLPEPGEEAAPAKIERRYTAFIIYNNIEYQIVLYAYTTIS